MLSSQVSSRSGSQGVAATVVAFIALVSLVGAVVAGSSFMPAGPVTGTNVTNPSTNLKFSMSLNSSSVQQGSVLAASFDLDNVLGRANNVTGAADWQLTNASENSGSVGWNCAQNDVFRIEVVSGYYGLNNYSVGTPLDVFLWQPPYAFNQCAYYVRSSNYTAPVLSVPPNDQNYYIFRPSSNVAWWVTSSGLAALSSPCVPSNGTLHCSRTAGQEAVMGETMILDTRLFANSTGTFTVIGGDEWGDVAALHFQVGPAVTHTASSSTATAVGPTYVINGLTCHVPAAYQSYPSVIHLLPLVTTNPKFLNLTGGMPFVFGNAENITDSVQQIGNQPPVHLPDALEMVFYSTGPNTSCGMLLGGSETTIDVQVPIQNGAYNMTGATFNGLLG